MRFVGRVVVGLGYQSVFAYGVWGLGEGLVVALDTNGRRGRRMSAACWDVVVFDL